MIDLELYKQIQNDPATEMKALSRRAYAFLEDGAHITDHVTWHFVFMIIRQLGKMAEEWDMALAMTECGTGVSDVMQQYYATSASAKRVLITQSLAIMREELDNLDAKKVQMEAARVKELRYAAEQIRSELVCCDIHQRVENAYTEARAATGGHEEGIAAQRAIMRSPDYHAICHYGEWSARIVEEQIAEDDD